MPSSVVSFRVGASLEISNAERASMDDGILVLVEWDNPDIAFA